MQTTSIPSDLLTPLGAYLRLRDGTGGSFLLESVERGRLGRNSFIGTGSRFVSFEESEQLGVAVVGYLGYGLVELRRRRGITVAGTPERGAVLQKVRELVEFARGQGYAVEELVQMIENVG